MIIRRFLSDLGILVLHSTASAAFLLFLCYAATGQYLLATIAAVVSVLSIIGFWKLEPKERT